MSDMVGSVDPRHYAYRLVWSAGDDAYVATCAEFPSLSWIARSQVKALQGLEAVIRDVLADLESSGEPVPTPIAERTYSGRFNLRVGESLHRQLAIDAAQESMSLNQYILRKLAG